MLIGSIAGPDFESAMRQVARANELCDAVELRRDLMTLTDKEFDALKLEVKRPLMGDEVVMVHDFEKTPQDLDAFLAQLMTQPAKFYKIACMANSTLDALRMLLFVRKKRGEGIPLAGMCMGPLGAITRILAPVVGGALTYSYIERETAPGQLSAEELTGRYHYHSLSPKTRLFGLIGQPVSQSPSHRTHNAFFQREGIDAVYVKMDVRPEELSAFLPLAKEVGFEGLSVTIPHKEAVLSLVDGATDKAKAIGAINTLHLRPEGIWGENTDAPAALDVLGEVESKTLLLIGSGGAARAIAYEAAARGANLLIWNRTYERALRLAQDVGAHATKEVPGQYDILVNATPEGMPISQEQLISKTLVMDINLSATPLLHAAQKVGCQTIEGSYMFKQQALRQFHFWSIKYQTQSL
jgi:3-dehydroquinate dehydratase/shikimate dehydrogenase